MTLSTLKALVEAGKEATEGNLRLDCRTKIGSGFSITATDVHYCRAGIAHYGSEKDMSFFVLSGNARPALTALVEVLEGIDAEALGEAISEMKERIECIKRPDDYPKEKYKTTWAIYEAAKAVQKIIGRG